jgi:lysophospholipase L1-like esterase
MRIVGLLFLGLSINVATAQELFQIPAGVETRWFSFENPGGVKGEGGKANLGRKGAPARAIKSGETVTLADAKGPGVIRRIWCTVRGNPEFLRGLVIRMYWDGQRTASVEAPLQDFFGIPFARQVAFESALFSNPEARSFNCFVPMPFERSALVQITNESPTDVPAFFYDIDATIGDRLPADLAYFHARYRRENPTRPKEDFEVLPEVSGKGRYLGCNVGVRPIGPYKEPVWFGEGELKIYVDGDKQYPTLVGTGTEDLVGSGWGLAGFNHLYQGCLLTEKKDRVWGFYRYHIPDPVFFQKSVRVTLQQMSGASRSHLKTLRESDRPELVRTHRVFDPASDAQSDWENFEAPQDVCATAYWYQTLPSPTFGPLEPYPDRMKDLALDQANRSFKFDFGPGPAAPGYTRVTPADVYSDKAGFGFEPGAPVTGENRSQPDPLLCDFVTSDQPFYFSVAVPEGNYRVKVTLGDPAGESATTIKAELRRLMVERAVTARAQSLSTLFTVNVRTPRIPGGGEVRLKDREKTSEWAAWDGKLTLEFNGARPCIEALEIEPADDVPTLFLLGDSTVCDQPREPWNSWGQMITRFFQSGLAVANHAESGESLESSFSARRFDKVFSLMHPGDYLFMQFGHNDMKSKASDALALYQANLERAIAETRRLGGIPVLVTSMERKAGVENETLGQYPEMARQVARQKGVALIDLQAMSRTLYRALGTHLDKAFQDGTHHNNYGSYELAKCVLEGIRENKLPLVQFMVDEFQGLDPAKPDPIEKVAIPASGGGIGAKPLGS